MKRSKPTVQNDNSSRWTTAEKALEHLRSGMRVFVGSGCAAPQKLVAALAARDAVNECVADSTPIFLSDVPALFRLKKIHLDVAFVQVRSPDSHGFCSFG